MRNYKIKTIKGILNITNQFNLNNFMEKRIYHIKKGYTDLYITDELNNTLYNMFIQFLGINNLNNFKSCGIMDRVILNKHNLDISYIAGQDYPSELRYIKKLLK